MTLTVIDHLYYTSLQYRTTITHRLEYYAGDYLSRTLDFDNIPDDLMNFGQQTNGQQVHDMHNQVNEQPHENRAHRRSRRRAQKEWLEDAHMQEEIAHQRASRQSIPRGERHAQLERSNARFEAKRNMPPAESITLSCPDLGTSSTNNPALSAHTQAYTIGTDGNGHIFSLLLCPEML